MFIFQKEKDNFDSTYDYEIFAQYRKAFYDCVCIY